MERHRENGIASEQDGHEFRERPDDDPAFAAAGKAPAGSAG
jgi:hypothetical protein